MNQLNLHNPIIVNFINNTINSTDESNVSALWNGMLTTLGFTMLRGYGIYPEKITIDGTKSDLVVKLILQNVTIMIIECKSIMHNNIRGWDAGGTQLADYLLSEGCRYGVLAIGNKCKFYDINNNFVKYTKEYDWSNDFDEIIQQLSIFSQTHNFQIS